MRIDDFIHYSNKATSVEELFALYEKAMAPMGFDRLLFCLMTEHDFINRPAGHGIIGSYPEDWMKYYYEQDYEKIDPVRRDLYSSQGIFAWEDLLKIPNLTKRQITLLKEGEEAGLRNGIGIPLRGPRGALAGMGAASSSGKLDMDKDTLSFAHLLSQQFYTAFIELEKQESVLPVLSLSEREQEILQWCARGKTKWEISEIIKLSEHTVDFHVRGVLKKLQANNITLATLKAVRFGLIQQ